MSLAKTEIKRDQERERVCVDVCGFSQVFPFRAEIFSFGEIDEVESWVKAFEDYTAGERKKRWGGREGRRGNR